MSQVTNYDGISKIYFNKILLEIVKIGNLFKTKKKILDYGCGKKQLGKILKKKIYNYDIIKKYNEVKILDFKKYDIIIFNHVLMYLNKKDINILFDNIYSKNKNCLFIVGLGKQNLISKLAMFISFNFNAHYGTISNYKDQLEVIENRMNIIKNKKNIFFMTDIFYLRFKHKNKENIIT